MAYIDQDRIPTTDHEKDELYRAGLGEKEISFEDLDISEVEFREAILETFPKLTAGGGFRFLKGQLFYLGQQNNHKTIA